MPGSHQESVFVIANARSAAVDFPYVLVRLRCDICKRAGAYRLARLAVKHGAEILL